MSVASPRSPRHLAKKPSLSILSGSSANKLNHAQSVFPQKPINERIVSDSTGLIKFCLRKVSGKEEVQDKENGRQGLPLYIPLEEEPHGHSESTPLPTPQSSPVQSKVDQSLLYRLAEKQRRVLDLREELAETEQELEQLKTEYAQQVGVKKELPVTPVSAKPGLGKKKGSIMDLGLGVKKSILNLRDEKLPKEAQALAQGFSSLSQNIASNPLVSRGRSFFTQINRDNEKWINKQTETLRKKIQQDPVLSNVYSRLNVFDKKDSVSYDDESSFMDPEETQYMDYSGCVGEAGDQSRDILSFHEKISGTIIYDDSRAGAPKVRITRHTGTPLCSFPSDDESET